GPRLWRERARRARGPRRAALITGAHHRLPRRAPERFVESCARAQPARAPSGSQDGSASVGRDIDPAMAGPRLGPTTRFFPSRFASNARASAAASTSAVSLPSTGKLATPTLIVTVKAVRPAWI